MKLRYLFVFICLFLVNINYVDASSIEYNLTIDDDVNFIENNIYKIDKSDIDRTSYNHITSILDDDIYFDNDKTILYKKEKTNNGDFYTVSLKHKYSTYFFNNSRIINECFEWAELKSNVDSISFAVNNCDFSSAVKGSFVISGTTEYKSAKVFKSLGVISVLNLVPIGYITS